MASGKFSVEYVLKVTDKASKVLSKLQRQADKLDSSLMKLSTSAASAFQKLGASAGAGTNRVINATNKAKTSMISYSEGQMAILQRVAMQEKRLKDGQVRNATEAIALQNKLAIAKKGMADLWGTSQTQINKSVATAIRQQQLQDRAEQANINAAQTRMKKRQKMVSETYDAAISTFDKTAQASGVSTLALGSAIYQTMKPAAQFELGMRKINSMLQMNDAGFKKMYDSVLGISGVTYLPQELASAMYPIVSSGYNAAEGLNIVNQSALLATAGMGQLKPTADIITTALNVYGKQNISTAKASDILLQTVILGKTELGELSHSFGRIMTTAQLAGVSLKDAGTAVATLTLAGVNTNEAMTYLGTLFSKVIGPSTGASKAAKKYGVDLSAVALRSKGLMPFLTEIAQKVGMPMVPLSKQKRVMLENAATWGQMEKAMGVSLKRFKELFPNINSTKAALILLSGGAERWRSIQKQMDAGIGEGSLTMKVYGENMRATSNKAKLIMADFEKAKITLGQNFIDALTPAISKIAEVAKGFNMLSPAMRSTIVSGGIGATAFMAGTFALSLFGGTALKTLKVLGAVGGFLTKTNIGAGMTSAIKTLEADMILLNSSMVATSFRMSALGAGSFHLGTGLLTAKLAAGGLSTGLGILGIAAGVAGAAFVGFTIGNFIRGIKLGNKTIGEMVDELHKTQKELDQTAIKTDGWTQFLINQNKVLRERNKINAESDKRKALGALGTKIGKETAAAVPIPKLTQAEISRINLKADEDLHNMVMKHSKDQLVMVKKLSEEKKKSVVPSKGPAETWVANLSQPKAQSRILDENKVKMALLGSQTKNTMDTIASSSVPATALFSQNTGKMTHGLGLLAFASQLVQSTTVASMAGTSLGVAGAATQVQASTGLMKTGLDTTTSAMTTLSNNVASGSSSIISNMGSAASSFGSSLQSMLGMALNIGDQIVGALSKINVSGAIANVKSSLNAGLASINVGITGMMGKGGGSSVPSKAEGGMILKSGLIIAHAGELIGYPKDIVGDATDRAPRIIPSLNPSMVSPGQNLLTSNTSSTSNVNNMPNVVLNNYFTINAPTEQIGSRVQESLQSQSARTGTLGRYLYDLVGGVA
jgi:hypothetical protein